MNNTNKNEIPKIIRQLLKKRGIESDDALEEYLSYSPKKTYNPFLLNHMEAGVDLILSTIATDGKIVIYGDYDTDGITSTGLLLKVLGRITDKLGYYIPSRTKEGYGLNKPALDIIKEEGAELIITVDCGSVAEEEIQYANSIGLKTVVTDHHTIGERMAEGIVINPKAFGDEYPFKELAGVGVAFKLAQAIQRKTELPKEILGEVLDLVAIGTIGDMVSLTDENRTLVKYGIKLIKSGEGNRGLKRLLEKSGIKFEDINSKDISYGLVPKINAAGRMGDASLALKLIMADTDEGIEKYCEILIDNNNMRKSIQDEVYDDCVKIVQSKFMDNDFLVIDASDAHEGITGIVAGKLKEKYQKPVIVVTDNENGIKGTGRSVDGVNLYDLINSHNELFLRFGGHKAACGFMTTRDSLDEIRKCLNDDIRRIAENNPEILSSKEEADMSIGIDEADENLVSALMLMEPTGTGNQVPLFMIKNAKINDYHFMGSEGTHARFSLSDDKGDRLSCVLFGKAKEYEESITGSDKVNVLGYIELNQWQNRQNIQMKVKYIT